MQIDEAWVAISGWPVYEVSSMGQIRRADTGRILKPSAARGYLHVSLYRDKNVTTRRIAPLVAVAFIGTRPVGMKINHIDGIKANNAASNLEYVTHQENIQHAYRNNLIPRGEDLKRAKLNNEAVRQIRQRSADGESNKSIAKDYPVSSTVIDDVVNKKKWKHVV